MLWHLTKQSQFEYSTALDCKGEVRAVEDSDEVIIYKKEKERRWFTVRQIISTKENMLRYKQKTKNISPLLELHGEVNRWYVHVS